MDPDTDLLLQATTSVAAGRTVWSGAPRTLCSKRKRESSRVPARVYRPSVVSYKKKEERAVPAILFDKIFHSFLQVFLIFVIFWSVVASFFPQSCYQYHIKINKKQLNMSIPSSYLTTMAWEKFVEKHDDFMRNFKTKVKNEKRNKKLCFLIKW